MISKIATSQILHCQVEIIAILESLLHVDDKWVLELVQNLFFIDD